MNSPTGEAPQAIGPLYQRGLPRSGWGIVLLYNPSEFCFAKRTSPYTGEA